MSIPSPSPPEVLIARKIAWRKRLWVRVLFLLSILMITCIAIWWWPRRTIVAAWWVHGEVTSEADRAITLAIVQWWDPSGTGWTTRNWELLWKYSVLTRTDAEITGVNLMKSPVDDRWLAHLRRTPKIEWMFLDDNQIGPGLENLRDHQKLNFLGIMAPSHRCGESLMQLRQLPGLERLEISNPQCEDIGLGGLTLLPRLKELRVSKCKTTADVLSHLPESPQIGRLTLVLCSGFAGDDLTALQRLPNLKELAFRRAGPIDDQCLMQISRSNTLEKLFIIKSAGTITDAGLEALQRLEKLTELSLTGDFTPQQIQTLKQLLPNATVSVY